MANVRHIQTSQGELRLRLLPVLRGRVFHVATPTAYRGIVKTGTILPTPPEPEVRTWKYDAYFRSIGCVSLCDLRGVDDDKLDLALSAYYFLDPKHGNPDPVFLLLAATAARRVITYSEAIARGASLNGKIVPHIEAGYPGDLPLASIDEVIFVEIQRPPASPYLDALLWSGGPA